MPYKIEQRGSKWYVVKDDGSGQSVGSHTSRADAEFQLKAIHTSEPEAEVEALFRDASSAFGESGNPQARIW